MTIDRDLARRIALVVLDADGVLTDGGITFVDNPDGPPYGSRRFHVMDGIGVYMLRQAGVELAIVSGKDSGAVRARAAEIGIDEVHQVPPWEKVATVGRLLDRLGVGWAQTACLADDLADLALLERVGLPAAVPNAAPEVQAVARWIGTVPGGEGAVREFAEWLLRSRGVWSDLVERYVARCRADGDGDASPGTGAGPGAGGGNPGVQEAPGTGRGADGGRA